MTATDDGIFVSARTLTEYEAMFGLSPDALQGTTLDCASGAAGFVAEAAERGHEVTGCDPLYELERATVVQHVRSGVERARANVAAEPSRYSWDFVGDASEHGALRTAAAERFLADHRRHPERYVPGSLPCLPFADGSFDLVLSSHLLFTYAGVLSLDFHVQAALELVRVSRAEVRIFPLVGFHTPADDELAAVLTALEELAGVTVELVPVPYHFQAGADTMLRVGRAR